MSYVNESIWLKSTKKSKICALLYKIVDTATFDSFEVLAQVHGEYIQLIRAKQSSYVYACIFIPSGNIKFAD